MYGDYYFPGEELDQMAEGGIPSRYKNMGFSKVGAKKKSTRPGKKWMVLAKKGDKYKVVHGGDSKMKDFSQHGSEKRKDRFWDRMGGKDSAKANDPFSPLYWHKRLGTWAEGGEPQNPGFQALPPYVQAKIMANMMYGGDMYAMGGTPCYECGGKVRYAQYGEEFNPPMGSELDEYDFQKGVYGDLYADSLEKIKPVQMDWTDYETLQGELEALNGMTDRQQKKYEKSPLYRKMFASGNVDKVDYMPGFDSEGGMAAIKNAMFTTYRPGEASGRFNPTLSTKRGSLSLRGNENSKLNPYLKAAAMIGKGVLNVGAFVGKNAKKNRALNEAMRENLTDNAFPVIPMGITGAMGNFDVFGAFRPDETHASRTYYNQAGGEIEMTDDQIRQLVALGAEIEILD